MTCICYSTILYPNRNIPLFQTFTKVHRRLGECGTGIFNENRGIPRTIRIVEQGERFLNIIDENPSTVPKKIGIGVGTGHATVWRILRDEQIMSTSCPKNASSLRK